MSDKMMWFGNRAHMQWIPCAQAGSDQRTSTSNQGGQFLHGGSYRRQTLNGTKNRQLNWALAPRDSLRPVTDYHEGVYGPGPFYWVDPFNADKNVLAQSFATPSLGGYDAITLNGAIKRPQLVPTNANSLAYPPESALYSLNDVTDYPVRHWIPIPPGHTAWVGVHGSLGSGGAVYARTTKGREAGGTPQELTILPVTSSTRVVDSFDSGTNVDGIEIWVGGTGTITLSGIMAQVIRTGVAPATGGFISGQGHSGMSFDGDPEVNVYSAAMDLMGVSAAFVETEQWV